MGASKKNNSVWFGYEIQTASGPILQPTYIQFWNDNKFKSHNPESPFYYKSDALVGLSLIQLNKHLQNPFSTPKMNFSFAVESWHNFEPHHEMWIRSQPRVQSLKKYQKHLDISQAIQTFESNFSEVLGCALTTNGIDLNELTGFIKAIDYLEAKIKTPLLYNFHISFPKEVIHSLQCLHSLLFNLRALIALDHNARVTDTSYEAVKMDSIADYLPKADYISNDAILYWTFKEISHEIPVKACEKLTGSFVNYSHNAVCLVESLPKSFLKSISKNDLEDTLYLTQMDWLLGTDAGLLFRVREELYGLLEGYEKVFWHDLEGRSHETAHALSVNCEVKETDWNNTVAA